MRPDLDEYEELNPESGEPRSRAMSWLVLGVAVVGFGALAYYAYQSGSQSVADGQMLVVNAEEGPIKEVPAEAGGEQFPHKDKTIYDALSPYRTDQKVEALLPQAEKPVIPEPAVGAEAATKAPSTTSYVNEAKVATSEEGESVVEAPAAAVVATKQVDKALAVPTTKPPVPMPVEKPAPAKLETVEVKETPVATKVTAVAAPKPAPKPPESKPAVKAAPAPVASSGNYKIQLGALGSEAEARSLWSKITAKNGDVVKGSPLIVKAEVNGKTYYRLRASGFATADAAKKACATLTGRGQACIPAGK